MELLHITFIHRHNLGDDGEDKWWRMRCAGAGCSLACRGPDLGNRNEKPTQQMTAPQAQPTIHACLRRSASARYSYLPIPLYTMQRVMGMWRL